MCWDKKELNGGLWLDCPGWRRHAAATLISAGGWMVESRMGGGIKKWKTGGILPDRFWLDSLAY